jgi:hypothetical protein
MSAEPKRVDLKRLAVRDLGAPSFTIRPVSTPNPPYKPGIGALDRRFEDFRARENGLGHFYGIAPISIAVSKEPVRNRFRGESSAEIGRFVTGKGYASAAEALRALASACRAPLRNREGVFCYRSEGWLGVPRDRRFR